MKRNYRKYLLPFCGFALLFGGCAQNDEQKIETLLSQDLNGYKEQDSEALDDLVTLLNAESFETYGIDSYIFVQDYLEGFDYSIDSIEVSDDTAKVQVTLTNKSMADYNEKLEAASADLNQEESSQEEINEQIGQMVLESMSEAEVVEKEPVTLTYTKTEDGWQADEQNSEILAAALNSN
jgi:hypothetical protein